jgi:conjugative relaxase-like TrwC/TraI family protein
VLTVKRIHAGRAAVDYYLNQTRRGLADYYLPEPPTEKADEAEVRARLSAPGSSWWGGGSEALGLSGEVERRQFVPMYAKGVRPGGGYLGTKFRQPEEVDAARAAALQAASEIADPYERWMAKHEIRRKGGHASVAAWDCTFSPPKSVSLLWASGDDHVQRQVWAAHTAAVDAGLAYLQEHASYVRAGRNGVRVLDTTGLVVARMNEWTSRDGDMHLHTHCLLLNRAETVEDGKWRALDGRAVLAARTGAGALYNRTVEAELTRRLGVGWRDRPDGLRELDGVDDELIDAFSSRRRAITAKVEELAAAYRVKYGIDPPPAVLNAMGQTAWSATRRRKHVPDPADALEQWEETARDHGRRLAELPARVISKARPVRPAHEPGADVDRLLAALAAGGRATFSRHDLLRAALDVLPPRDDTAEVLEARADDLVNAVVRRPELIGVTAPDLIEAPATLRRGDGTSVYEQPARHRWALRSTLDQETWLLDVAVEDAGHQLDPPTLETAITDHGLGDDQADAARQLLGSPERIGLLVGPAGAGKTRTLRAVVAAWQHTGRPVLGLTVSQAAAQVLADEAHVRAENTAKWLHETARGRWAMPDGALVLIDEASMVSTRTLVDLVEQTRRAGGKVLMVGDPAQLTAIHIGGAFDLLADRLGASHLHEIRRFTEPWERHASQLLRRRDPAALAEYAMRARIHGGRQTNVESGLFHAWQTDALAADEQGGRRSVLMIVSTNEQAAVLAERARHTLIERGAVSEGPTVQLRDNLASIGDHIVTRRNDRRLVTSNRGWVVNGDLWTIIEVYDDGAVDARRHGDGATITLPADYLTEHCHLGYATTAHRAQGMTVDICHAAMTHATSHEALYVAATRGRDGNHLWVATDTDREVVRDADDLPAPESVLSRILERRDPDRLSVHQAIEESLTEMSGLARLGQVFEDAARTATDEWLGRFLADRGLGEAVDDPEWSTLLTTARQAALAGHDLDALIDDAIAMRSMAGAESVAAVLDWRVGMLADASVPARHRGPLASLPPKDGPAMEVARQAGGLIRERWRQTRATLAEAAEASLPWAAGLGPQPTEPEERSAWLTAATAITAYRERFEVPAYTPTIGARPSSSRPDARAAWDHARLQTDRYLARRLRHLSDDQLDALDARQQAILDERPRFDPAELRRASEALTTIRSVHHTSGQVSALESVTRQPEVVAARHAAWKQDAAEASAIRSQIQLERERRLGTRYRQARTI